MAAAIISHRDPNAIIGSFAVDHMIPGDDAFLSAVAEAAEVATQGYLVTIGIAPSGPATGVWLYTTWRQAWTTKCAKCPHRERFQGKPRCAHCPGVREHGYLPMERWNVRHQSLLELLKEYKPALHEGLMEIAGKWDGEALRAEALEKIWPGLEKIPIDNAVAEPAAEQGRVAVVPATFGWDDVGDISTLADMLPAEASQPQILGDNRLGHLLHVIFTSPLYFTSTFTAVVTEQMAGGVIVPGSRHLVAYLGVDDLVIVDTPDALMVTTRTRSQEVKRLVNKCRDAGWNNLL
ncbi:hypothetical protein BD410DRAFT_902679 [Rickenella mellea]|uniref:MannoseP isomerase/GMP-like beta-helix domain-containing protein n=1 Tax=Rickenella mellea TaxID=50990 RepID=A0A4Y7PIC7_9AGAM|nr:hypothetical protein BD410DRAFT_902679 [Rickenella mellea]